MRENIVRPQYESFCFLAREPAGERRGLDAAVAALDLVAGRGNFFASTYTLFGQDGSDRLFGGSGPDRIYASLGEDFVDESATMYAFSQPGEIGKRDLEVTPA